MDPLVKQVTYGQLINIPNLVVLSTLDRSRSEVGMTTAGTGSGTSENGLRETPAWREGC